MFSYFWCKQRVGNFALKQPARLYVRACVCVCVYVRVRACLKQGVATGLWYYWILLIIGYQSLKWKYKHIFQDYTHTHTRTHTHVYAYVSLCLCPCVCVCVCYSINHSSCRCISRYVTCKKAEFGQSLSDSKLQENTIPHLFRRNAEFLPREEFQCSNRV